VDAGGDVEPGGGKVQRKVLHQAGLAAAQEGKQGVVVHQDGQLQRAFLEAALAREAEVLGVRKLLVRKGLAQYLHAFAVLGGGDDAVLQPGAAGGQGEAEVGGVRGGAGLRRELEHRGSAIAQEHVDHKADE